VHKIPPTTSKGEGQTLITCMDYRLCRRFNNTKYDYWLERLEWRGSKNLFRDNRVKVWCKLAKTVSPLMIAMALFICKTHGKNFVIREEDIT